MEKAIHFSVRLPAALNRYLKRRAKREVRSKNSLLETMIMEARLVDPNEARKEKE